MRVIILEHKFNSITSQKQSWTAETSMNESESDSFERTLRDGSLNWTVQPTVQIKKGVVHVKWFDLHKPCKWTDLQKKNPNKNAFFCYGIIKVIATFFLTITSV